MKKFLSLVLALVMTMSLVTVAGASFTDADDVNYDAAVDVMTALEVVGGYADGSFNPEGTLTRGAAAKIICNILVGPETASSLVANTAPYSDVPANHTFAGYIAYCAEKGIISGYADGTFRPAATLTGYAFVKMLLTGLGYDQTIEGYTGTNWAINVAEDAVENDLLDGLNGKFVGNKAITREEACLFALNALMAETVKYENKGSNISIGDIQINTAAGSAKGTEKALYETNFETLKKDDTDVTDALGRPAYEWSYEKEEIGVYADAADLVLENYMDKDDIDELLDDEDLTVAVDKDGNPVVDIYVTENGATVELFANDDDEIVTAVKIEAKLMTGKITKDKVSTKDKDERAVTFSGGKVVADADVTKGAEIDNFEAVYEAADDDADQLFLVIVGNDGIYSVEIPETVEAKITRVKGDEIVAGGETYLLTTTAEKQAALGEAELTVGANGVVYNIAGVSAEESDVIFLDYVSDETDKWGETTYTAQIVNEDNEVVEVALAAAYKDNARGFYTYEVNDDDEYELKAVTAKKADSAMDDEDTYVKFAGKKAYFDKDMVVVYIADTKADLEVTVKDGAQNVTGDHYVLNDDGDVVAVYVLGEYESGESEEVIFIADVSEWADVTNDDGKDAKAYNAYVDGSWEEVMIKNAKTGFWTYTINEKTGEYELKTEKGYFEKTVTITKDTYVSYDKIDDATVTGEIVDMTKEDLYTLADIAEWDGDALVVSFLYDADENEITLMVVDFA